MGIWLTPPQAKGLENNPKGRNRDQEVSAALSDLGLEHLAQMAQLMPQEDLGNAKGGAPKHRSPPDVASGVEPLV